MPDKENVLSVDTSTFCGRIRHFSRLTSPLNLFATREEILHAKDLITAFKANKPLPSHPNTHQTLYTNEELLSAKYLVDSSIHPDTGDLIMLPFRMSSFVPTNLIVTAGLLVPNPSVPALIFWQWANQSVNVGINWANANKSTTMSTEETAVAYGTAVGASVGVALGMSQLVQRIGSSVSSEIGKSLVKIAGRLVPFVAVAAAGSLNVYLMRRKEIRYYTF
jgi:hypothetical protein